MKTEELEQIKKVTKEGVQEALSSCCIFDEGQRGILHKWIRIGEKIEGWIVLGVAASIATPALLALMFIMLAKYMRWF